MTKTEIIQRLLDPGLIAIMRADSSAGLLDAAGALLRGGVAAMEVTMTTPNALQTIAAIAQQHPGIVIGVGSVIAPETVHAAVAAGAQFVVTPTTNPAVIGACNALSVPIASGAFTPMECLLAHESGADFVKLFPAEFNGPAYIKTLLAPLPMLRIVPAGGVTPETAGAFLAAGSVALGVGSALVSKEILQRRDWAQLTTRAAAFVQAVQGARK